MTQRIQLPSVVFETTSRCNLACRYCYNIHKAPGGPQRSLDGWKRSKKTLARLFATATVSQVTLSGGEPFESERLLELALYCRMKGARVAIITNGTRGTEDDYRSLVKMGIKTFELPFHSLHESEHEAMTGVEGSHAKVRASIAALQELGATVVPVIVLTKLNVASLSDTLRFLGDLGLQRIMLNRFNVGGAGIGFRKLLELSIEELRSAYATASAVAKTNSLKLTSNVCSPVCVLDPKDYPGIGFSKCSPDIARRPLTLDPEGNLRFCNHSPHNLGNIFKDRLSEMFASDYACSWSQVPTLCEGCQRWKDCFGGCRAASEQLGGSLEDADPLIQPVECHTTILPKEISAREFPSQNGEIPAS